MTIYTITLTHGDTIRMDADLSQASAPVYVDGTLTPYRTVDARHDATRAAKLGLDWLTSQGASPGVVVAVDVATEESLSDAAREMLAYLRETMDQPGLDCTQRGRCSYDRDEEAAAQELVDAGLCTWSCERHIRLV